MTRHVFPYLQSDAGSSLPVAAQLAESTAYGNDAWNTSEDSAAAWEGHEDEEKMELEEPGAAHFEPASPPVDDASNMLEHLSASSMLEDVSEIGKEDPFARDWQGALHAFPYMHSALGIL